METHTRAIDSDLVAAARATAVAAALAVDNAGSGAGGAALEFSGVEVNYLGRVIFWRGNDGGGDELSREEEDKVLEKHLVLMGLERTG
ncbi:hypothetical protein ColLi_11144 [Colletotrichum liriopes]|uniref:Uncharacterized protein n=1 Tax=Colletotrichum liriopes TaxID=708192 RepID=A0AA37GW22_9PEZI|nr:hypothetical protein ColLi_11144 [Colletotrichum liriopes]